MDIKLREMSLETAEFVRQWRNEDLAGLRTSFLLTKEMQADFYKNVLCNRNSNIRYWTVWDDDVCVGATGLVDISWENGIAEIALIIRPELRNKGYGEWVVDEILKKGFGELRLQTVIGESYEINTAVDFWKKIAKKYNAYETHLPNRKFLYHRFWHSYYFSIDADEYRRTKNLREGLKI